MQKIQSSSLFQNQKLQITLLTEHKNRKRKWPGDNENVYVERRLRSETKIRNDAKYRAADEISRKNDYNMTKAMLQNPKMDKETLLYIQDICDREGALIECAPTLAYRMHFDKWQRDLYAILDELYYAIQIAYDPYLLELLSIILEKNLAPIIISYLSRDCTILLGILAEKHKQPPPKISHQSLIDEEMEEDSQFEQEQQNTRTESD